MSDDDPEPERIPDTHAHFDADGNTLRHTHAVPDGRYHPVSYRLAHGDPEPDTDDPVGWHLPSG